MEKEKLDKYGNCPICKKSWDNGSIPANIRHYYSTPYRFSKLLAIETFELDGVSMWQCPFCKTKWDRFTEEIIK